MRIKIGSHAEAAARRISALISLLVVVELELTTSLYLQFFTVSTKSVSICLCCKFKSPVCVLVNKAKQKKNATNHFTLFTAHTSALCICSLWPKGTHRFEANKNTEIECAEQKEKCLPESIMLRAFFKKRRGIQLFSFKDIIPHVPNSWLRDQKCKPSFGN